MKTPSNISSSNTKSQEQVRLQLLEDLGFHHSMALDIAKSINNIVKDVDMEYLDKVPSLIASSTSVLD